MTTYFISDIHLHANSNFQAQLLIEFLNTKAIDADALYIVGDLFAIWLGDDLKEPYSLELIAALKKLSAKVPIYIMHGNRDFLIGKKFCNASGAKLLPDPSIITIYGQKILLTHGDQLCTLDISYQKFRRIVQNPILNKIFLLLPIQTRRKIGRFLSKKSRNKQDPEVYNVANHTVEEWFNKYNTNLMIHGHTHMPAIHNDNQTKRIVLGDWEPKSAQILCFQNDRYELIDLLAK